MPGHIGSRTGIEWCNIYDDPQQWERRHPDAVRLTRWFGDHLIRPHPDLGRDGPVCPFMRQSMARHLLWGAMVPGGDELTVEQMTAAVDDAIEVDRALRADDAAGPMLASVTVFPELTRYHLIDTVHLAHKTGVVEQGLMIGQFYPGCAVSGLWNRDFRPLAAPVPMLVIRRMMNTDFPFLAERTEWLYAYLGRIAPELPRKLRWSIAERMRVDEVGADAITDLRMHAPGEHAR